MAGFHTKTFLKHDDYMTPKSAWKQVAHLLPKDKVIWEAFYGDGKSGKYLSDLGFNTIHKKVDFFENNFGEIIVSNPPFSLAEQIFERLFELDKPFMLLLPAPKIFTNYMRKWQDKNLQFIIPRTRIQFIKNGVEKQGKCNFDCLYYCYKLNLPHSNLWLQNTLNNFKEKNIKEIEKDGEIYYNIKIKRKKQLICNDFLNTDQFSLEDAIRIRDECLSNYKSK